MKKNPLSPFPHPLGVVATVAACLVTALGCAAAEIRVGVASTDITPPLGIPGAHVLISATHAHTGPELADRGTRGSDMGGQSQLAVEPGVLVIDR
jgi:hypothetical protein